MESTAIQRLSKLLLWGALVWLPCLGYWAAQVRFGTPEVSAWLPGEDAARAVYREFLEQFGDDQVLFVTWPNCTLDDPRLGQLSGYLQELARTQPQLGISQVQDSSLMLQRWLDAHSELSLPMAQQQLQGFAIGADGSCFIALHVDAELGERRAPLVHTLRQSAQQIVGIDSSELILAGEPFQVYVIDRASRETIERFVPPSSLLALVVAWLCLRRFRLTLLVFVLAGLGQLIGLALIAVFFGEMSAVLVVLPTLVFMLTLSGAVHLTNYFRDVEGQDVAGAGVQAFRLGARPCVLATLTTIFGFGSLLVSQLQPVWQFGSLAALGLLLSTALLLGLFPAAVSLAAWRPSNTPRSSPTEREKPHRVLPSSIAAPRLYENDGGGRACQWLTELTARHASLISLLGVITLLLSLAGLLRLKTSTEFEDMFPPSSPAIESLRWMQSHLGPINSLELVLSFPKNANEDVLAQAQLLAAIHTDLTNSAHVSAVLSAATFLPPLDTGQGMRATIRRAVLRRTLSARREDLQADHLLAEQPDAWRWRLSARIHNLAGDSYHRIQTQLAAVVQARIDAQSGTLQPTRFSNDALTNSGQASFVITGLQRVIEKAHLTMLTDLGGSFAMAFLLIVPVMMLIVRSVRAGLLLMLPNVLPVAMVFGAMGWLSVKLDVASILTASVALGIAVDDTLHFMTWFLRGRAQGLEAKGAVRHAIAGCARAMLHTSIICTGSMLPFFFCDFVPTSKFALLMILILGGAIVGDLLLLPAILQSRYFGQRCFGKQGGSTR
ncbi:MAG: MMPL family transporter [Pirellulaceae bacterium]|jgi:predicted RND superfamily exporter protein|nr:MMPL family transporter [Pirellulaceae bacterium]